MILSHPSSLPSKTSKLTIEKITHTMSSPSPHGKYTDEDVETRLLHNHNPAIIGGPSSRSRHPTSFRDQSLGGKVLQIATLGVIVAFNVFLVWVVGRMLGGW